MQCTLANYVKFSLLLFAKRPSEALGAFDEIDMWDCTCIGASEPNDKFNGRLRNYGTGLRNLRQVCSGLQAEPTGSYRDMTAVPIDAQKKFILNYCDQHPSLEYAKAVMELYHYKLPLKKTPPASSR
jgi:hypothetical protein